MPGSSPARPDGVEQGRTQASSGTTDGTPGGERARPLRTAAAVLAVAVVLAQVAYPLVDHHPPTLRVLTVTTVLLFCAASLTHAAGTFGLRAAAALLGVAGGVGLLAEALGVATGVPFGSYSYAGTLGPQLLGVPLVVPLAWTMMAYPCLLAGRAVARTDVGAVLAAAWLLAAWDLFLDPQMVAAGHWRWTFPEPGLPGVDGVPLTNFAGWVAVALVLQALLHVALPRPALRTVPAVPAVLLAWTWLGSSLANAAFFGRPAVAVYGFLAMGAVAAPALARRWRPDRRPGDRR